MTEKISEHSEPIFLKLLICLNIILLFILCTKITTVLNILWYDSKIEFTCNNQTIQWEK